MKKTIRMCMLLTLVLLLTACGKSENAKRVDDLIQSIGEVTLDSTSKITEAEEAVKQLTDEEYNELDRLDELKNAKNQYEALLIEKDIDAIGEVTLDSASVITSARTNYNKSDDSVKKLVKNYSTLEAAETRLSQLKVSEVQTLIASVGDIDLNDVEVLEKAEKIYNSLSEAEKANVENRNVLTESSEKIKALRDEKVQSMLSKMRLENDDVRNMNFYYHPQFPDYVNTRSYVLPYIGTTDSNAWLRLRYLYTSDDWVFFESIVFAIDDERETKYFNYSDVERDNDGGDVWEYVDMDPSTGDIQLLEKIANSTNTVIRFQGDVYHYDLTVSDADKQAIREVLETYNYMKENA